MTAIDIRTDDLRGPEIAALLARHLDHMFAVTPAGSVYALDLDALRVPAITFWSAWIDGELVGCIALKALGGGHGEIKSAHTVEQMRGRGIASRRIWSSIFCRVSARSYRSSRLQREKLTCSRPCRTSSATITNEGIKSVRPYVHQF